MAVLTIAVNAVRRLARDRSNWFFVFVFPLALILLIGAAFGGSQELRLAVVADDVGDLGDELITDLEALDGLVVDRYETASAASEAVSRGQANGALLIPDGYTLALRAGQVAELGFIARPDSLGPAVRSIVDAVIQDQAMVLAAADLVTSISDTPIDDAIATARRVLTAVPGVSVEVKEVGTDELAEEFAGLGQFDLGASQQLMLFVFLTSLSGAATIIQNRELGVTRRTLAAPVSTRQILLGEGLGRFLVALTQGIYIVVGTTLLFGVNWGDWVATAAILVVFCLVSAAAAMLAGATLKNQSQAGGIGVGLGIGLGALGGSMLPLEIMPSGMRALARLTPHSWALEGYAEVVRRGGGVLDVLPQLAVLTAMAVLLLLVGGWALRRTLTHPA
jgi:ABC-2 type transport system permease protein